MTGTSPFTQNTPSFHSSSYLPKLEASFFKDFSCCGNTLPSLHDLLQHYEECHAHQPPSTDDAAAMQQIQQQQQVQPTPEMMHGRGAFTGQMAGGISGIGLGMMRQQQLAQQRMQEYHENSHQDAQNHDRNDHDDGEAAGEMDLDTEETTPPANFSQSQTPKHPLQQTHFQLGHSATPSMQRRLNQPNAPGLATTNIHGRTPLMNQFSPESSAPGTPLAMDSNDYLFAPSGLGGGMQLGQGYSGGNNSQKYQQAMPRMGSDGIGINLDLCIDDPGKRLYSPNGLNGLTQSQMRQLRMDLEQGMVGANQMGRYQNGMGVAGGGMVHPPGYDDKPFKCPVIGCEKAYKNQNGLKYHKGVSSHLIHECYRGN